MQSTQFKSLQQDNLRKFASNFVTGVAVITSRTHGSIYRGLTMNAVTSLSLKPPLYLVCLDNRSNTLEAVVESRSFAVNFLASHQIAVSQLFASKDPDKFRDLKFRLGGLRCPILEEVVAACECRVGSIYPGGDHKIVIGKVEHIHIFGGDPLVFHQGKFVQEGSMRQAPEAANSELDDSRRTEAKALRAG